MSRARVRKDHADTTYQTIDACEPINSLTCPCCGVVGGCRVGHSQRLQPGRWLCHHDCRLGGEWTIVWDAEDRPTLESEAK